ncbi:MAG TPA: 3-hydroxyacyl-CoA dehydrogenase NAD-binding domain-containing protein, partial [Planctomycetota bacterium]|nr:3-hydroxyacyl-CoA dehydrogenase NAD-binding domain-containing protein [Planctomycetota bacterium]
MAIENITVLGAGTMGHGIAQVAAMAGYRVTLYDVSKDFVDKGISRIADNLGKGVEKGKVTAAQRDAAMSCIVGADELEPAGVTADLVIEAVPEKMELKREIFTTLDRVTPKHCIYGSNTSSLSISALATGLKRPAQF